MQSSIQHMTPNLSAKEIISELARRWQAQKN